MSLKCDQCDKIYEKEKSSSRYQELYCSWDCEDIYVSKKLNECTEMTSFEDYIPY